MQAAQFYGITVPISTSNANSTGAQIRGGHVTAIIVPAAWTPAVMTFDGALQDAPGDLTATNTWYPLLDDTGVEISIPVSAGKCTILSPIKISGVDLIRPRSGTLAAPVSQSVSVNILLRVRAYE